jgi:hypothetical protein
MERGRWRSFDWIVGGSDRICCRSFVLESMLRLDPVDRTTAAECHKGALLFLEDDDDGAPESHPGGAGSHGHSNGLDIDYTEASTILAGWEADGSFSLLSRYTVATDEPGRRDERFCNAPSPETVVVAPLRAGQHPQKLRDPEDSLFCRSSFGEDLNSDRGSSAAPTVVIARDAVETHAEPTGQTQEHRPSESKVPIPEALAHALMPWMPVGRMVRRFLSSDPGSPGKRDYLASSSISGH